MNATVGDFGEQLSENYITELMSSLAVLSTAMGAMVYFTGGNEAPNFVRLSMCI